MCKKLPGKTRCKFHGGASTGPKSEEGKRQSAKNLEKARATLKAMPPEWFHEQSLKAAKTKIRRARL